MDEARRRPWMGHCTLRRGSMVAAGSITSGRRGGTLADQRLIGAPSLPDPLISRAALLVRLDEIARRAVTVVTAPAGVGKSMLLAQWCGERCGLPVLWIDATTMRDDPNGLLTRVVAATRAAEDRHRDAEAVELPPSAEGHLESVLTGLPEMVVVVDGVDSPPLMDATMTLASAVDRTSSSARLVVIGRCSPPPMFAALRVRGRAWQLVMPDLLLTDAEVGEVIAGCSGHQVDDAVVVELARRVEGWLAAAVMIGLSHPGGRCTADELFAAAADGIEAYVDTAVVAPLAEERQRFVMDTAVVEELIADLCDQLSGRDDSDQLLGRLRNEGFPIVRDLSGRMRYSRPVRTALDALAQRRNPKRHATRVRAAADWFAARQMPFEAAACLVRLAAWHDVVTVITHHLPKILERDEISRLAGLVKLAPPEVIREQSILALAGAWVLRMDGKVGAAAELLAVYRQYMTDRARMIADVSRASVASWVDNMDAVVAVADVALAACDRLGDDAFDEADSPFPSSYGETNTGEYRTLAHGAAQLACAYGGMWERGEHHRVDIAPNAAANMPQFQLVYLRGVTATFHALSGRAADALLEAYTAVSLAGQMGLLEHRMTADAHYALGEALRLSLRHDEAGEPLAHALRLAELNGRRNLIAAAIAAQAHLDVDAKQPSDALERIAWCRKEYPYRFPATIAGQLSAAEARAMVATGRFSAALSVLERAPATSPVAAVRVAAQLASGDVAGAQATVRNWPGEPTVDATVRRALAAAVICEFTGDRQRVALIRTSLQAAAPHRLGQPFIVYGPLTGRLLRQRIVGDDEFARSVHEWLAEHTPASSARLTGREAIVMSQIADGLNLPQVAETLHVSVNTVRSHAQAIYRKLGVDNRSDAIRAWRARTDPA